MTDWAREKEGTKKEKSEAEIDSKSQLFLAQAQVRHPSLRNFCPAYMRNYETHVVVFLEPNSVLLLVLLQLRRNLRLSNHVQNPLSSLSQSSILGRDLLSTRCEFYTSHTHPARRAKEGSEKERGSERNVSMRREYVRRKRYQRGQPSQGEPGQRPPGRSRPCWSSRRESTGRHRARLGGKVVCRLYHVTMSISCLLKQGSRRGGTYGSRSAR